MVRALDVLKLGKEVMTSHVRASRDLQGTIDLQILSCIRIFCLLLESKYIIPMTSCLSMRLLYAQQLISA